MARSAPGPRGGSPSIGWLLGAFVGILLIQALYGVVVFRALGPQMAPRGQFGDIFGGVNAFFTGAAFATLIYTILLQRKELELQREELRLTREELSRSTQAQTDQAVTLKESANLSAMTALVSLYGTQLDPIRARVSELAVEDTGLRTELERTPPGSYRHQEIVNRIKDISVQNDLLTSVSEPQRTKYYDLVTRLEEMVEHATPTESPNIEEDAKE